MADEKAIFVEALEKATSEERAAFLDQACGDDASLRASVEALLRAHDQTRGILESPVHVPPVEQVGSTVGPYKLLEKIGEGGMGVVYMAEQVRPVRRMVALKIIKPGMDSGQVIARFEAERQALAMMEHPNIARVLDAGTTESGRPYFAMELVKGIPITDYCDQARLNTRQRLKLFIDVCHAVQHAHTKGIIHRDLKPGNVLVTLHDDRPVPKVIDFGIAKATSGTPQALTERTLFTQFAQMMGTPMYMSPEQAALSAIDVDTRSDVYSLGVLLYELLTGTTPFDKQRLGDAAYEEIRRIIREEDPPTPSTRLSTLGEKLTTISTHRHTDAKKLGQIVRGELDWIVMRSLEKDRARRYETVNALAADVQRHLADQPVEACPPSAAYRFRKFARRNKPVLVTTSIIGVALLLGIIVSVWQAARAREQKREADRQRDAAAAEKRRADEQVAVTAAVSEFLQRDLLAQADASEQASAERSPDPNLTVRQALDRAAASIPTAFSAQPRVEVQIRDTIGKAYMGLGEYRIAEAQFDAALELSKRSFGDNDPLTLGCMTNLANCYRYQGRLKEAERLHKEALERLRAALGEDDERTLQSMHALGVTYAAQTRSADAQALLDRALAGRRRTLGEQHRATLDSMHSVAANYINQGRYSDGEPLQREVLEAQRRMLGESHPDTLRSLCNLGVTCALQNRLEEAQSLYELALEGQRRTLGEHHRDTMMALKGLAFLARDRRKDPTAALPYVKALLAAQIAANGEQSEGARDAMLTLAYTLHVAEQPVDAERYYRRALDVPFSGWHNAARRAEALYRLAQLLRERQRDVEADALAAELRTWLASHAGGETDADAGRTLNTFAWRLVTSADFAPPDANLALQLAQRAVELRPESGRVWGTLGVARYRAGDFAEAVSALEKSIQLHNGGTSVDFFFLAMAHHRLGDRDAARRWYDKGVQWMQQNHPGDPQLTRFRGEAEKVLGLPSSTRPSTQTAAAPSVP